VHDSLLANPRTKLLKGGCCWTQLGAVGEETAMGVQLPLAELGAHIIDVAAQPRTPPPPPSPY
jgi:hypothetical protein